MLQFQAAASNLPGKKSLHPHGTLPPVNTRKPHVTAPTSQQSLHSITRQHTSLTLQSTSQQSLHAFTQYTQPSRYS
ncbi:MAG: hypothetical protein IJR63_12040, partial [Synergistaceae bacterium]|nr:hypothetical protein [Synergistaceae bacterium]